VNVNKFFVIFIINPSSLITIFCNIFTFIFSFIFIFTILFYNLYIYIYKFIHIGSTPESPTVHKRLSELSNHNSMYTFLYCILSILVFILLLFCILIIYLKNFLHYCLNVFVADKKRFMSESDIDQSLKSTKHRS